MGNKKPVTFTLDPTVLDELGKLSKDTTISKSKLFEEALNDVMKKYSKVRKELKKLRN